MKIKLLVGVTGANGFIGSSIVTGLKKAGYEVICLVRNRSGTDLLPEGSCQVRYTDYSEPGKICVALEGVDVVCHCCGQLGGWGINTDLLYQANVELTRKVMQASVFCGVKRVLHLSSAGVYGPTGGNVFTEEDRLSPSNHYEESKVAAEEVVSEIAGSFIRTVIIRPEFVYGPRDMHLLGFFRRVASGVFPVMNNGKFRLHPTYIQDVVQATVKILNDPAISGTYLICGQRHLEWKEFLRIIAEIMDIKLRTPGIPLLLARSSSFLFEISGKLSGKEPLLTNSQVRFLSTNRSFSSSKATKRFGYSPIGLRDGISETVAWYRREGLLA
ncbi:MAG: NAD-dependent epimerase/dehydratase family protein [Candidatus Krumholzibacteriota bacterium]|nr:NAD-dependent epimerase/dehydratase family protein [Candidatus Krumholzibacteriota bacterium]